jgi:hypothetical protein
VAGVPNSASGTVGGRVLLPARGNELARRQLIVRVTVVLYVMRDCRRCVTRDGRSACRRKGSVAVAH